MKKKTNNYNGDVDDIIFEEEVPESSLHSKVKQNDVIYINSGMNKFSRTVLYVLLFLILAFSVLSMIFNFFGSHHKVIDEGNTTEYILNVIQSNEDYGARELDFTKYNTVDKAYKYNFQVKNSNNKKLNYSVSIVDPNFNIDTVNMKNISYKLIKDNEVVKSGSLKEIDSFEVYKTTIKSNSSDDYTLKLWSSKLNSDKLFSFKVDVTID